MTGEIGSLELQALKRKERLAALKASKEGKGKDPKETKEGGGPLPKPVFRSYKPLDEQFSEAVLPPAEPSDVRDKVQDELDKENEGLTMENLDFTNLAPRKPDWDLKRDIAPKLAKLERKTQKAIAELIRERLKDEDLANAVTAGASANQKTVIDDED
jgi:coiled-coil domain-containing protein 12